MVTTSGDKQFRGIALPTARSSAVGGGKPAHPLERPVAASGKIVVCRHMQELEEQEPRLFVQENGAPLACFTASFAGWPR